MDTTNESEKPIRSSSLCPMTPDIKGPERRQSTRTTVNSIVYIDFDSDNGGIVLNVSQGGLCFQSAAPIHANGTIRFWFSEHRERIEAEGELAWINETQKTGGLRFTALPAEGREQIRNWISEPTIQLAAEKPPARSVPAPSPVPVFSARAPAFSVSRHQTNVAPDSPALPAVGSPEIQVPAWLTGFSRGLATGILISALVAFLVHSHRGQLGESLIRLGERLAAKSRAQTQTVSPALQTALPPLRPSSPIPRQTPVSPPEKVLPRPLMNPPKPQQVKLELPRPTTASHSTDAVGPTNKAPGAAAAISSTPPTISSPTTAVIPKSNVIPDKIDTVPVHESANHATVTGEESLGSSSVGYFEVGKFKDDLGADKIANNLQQLGFHAAVIQKGHLWMNSYSVLVGPYNDHEVAEAARKDLVSHGFKPRAFERGSRSFTFPFALTLNGTQVPAGDYTISWESYSPDALVKFVLNYDLVATPEAKWMKRDVSYRHNAVAWRQNHDGSRSLIEIQFRGMSRALVFGQIILIDIPRRSTMD